MGFYQENVVGWSTVVLNTPGPPRGVVVPMVHLVHTICSDPHFSKGLPKIWTRVAQGGPGGPGGPQPPWVDQEWFLHFADVARTGDGAIICTFQDKKCSKLSRSFPLAGIGSRTRSNQWW